MKPKEMSDAQRIFSMLQCNAVRKTDEVTLIKELFLVIFNLYHAPNCQAHSKHFTINGNEHFHILKKRVENVNFTKYL